MEFEELDFELAEYGNVYLSEGVIIPGIACPWCGGNMPIDEAINDQPCDNCGKFYGVGVAKVGEFYLVTMSSEEFGPQTAEVYAKNTKAAEQKARKELGLSMDQEFNVEVEANGQE